MSRRGDWVVVKAVGVDPVEPRNHAVCTRCGERFVFDLPMKIVTFCEVSKGFVKAHQDCKEAT